MDSSKFSLKKAYEQINPIKDHLSFNPLADLFKEKRMFGSRQCSLQIWPRFVRSPLTVTERTMVYPVTHIQRMFFDSTDFSQVEKFTDGILLCHQNRAESEWLYMQTDYVQRGGGIFWSEASNITPVDDENFVRMANPPENFAEDLHAGITRWVNFSATRREKYVAALRSAGIELMLKNLASVQE